MSTSESEDRTERDRRSKRDEDDHRKSSRRRDDESRSSGRRRHHDDDHHRRRRRRRHSSSSSRSSSRSSSERDSRSRRDARSSRRNESPRRRPRRRSSSEEMSRKRRRSRSSSPTDRRSKEESTKSSGRPSDKSNESGDTKKSAAAVGDPKKSEELLTTKTGGAYIPPAKLRLMQQQITDKSSVAYQRLAWEALKKSINGLVNKVNTPNIAIIVRELFAENIVRGRGLVCQSIMLAQMASPTFTHVYAALISVINTKFPNIGELLLHRLILNFKRGFKRNDKNRCTSSSRFIAHLVNQQVAHEIISLEILTLLLERPTNDSVEVAISFLRECGQKLSEVSPRGIHAIFERLRHVLHESGLDKRTQYMIEVMFQVRKDGFKDNPAVIEELDLVEEEDQITHMITIDEGVSGQEILNVFQHDPEYEANEEKYKAIKAELLGDEDDDDDGNADKKGSDSDSSEGSDSDESEDSEGPKEEDTSAPIIDNTETNMISLRRTIYLTIQSSLDFEEAVHKLMKLNLKEGHEAELCHMIIDCCAQQRTYEKFFGLMAQRLCQLNRIYVQPFEQIFADSYTTVHRFEIGKLRNVAKLFAHLLFTDAINWTVLAVIRLNENDTTSSSRIFIKILFQELAEYMGMNKLMDRVRDATLQEAFDGLFPRDDPCNTRFSINFFTTIGLGGLTEDLRVHLKSKQK